MPFKVAVVVPTYNGGDVWERCAYAIHNSRLKIDTVLCVDSSSTDNSVEIARKYGFDVLSIPKENFNHGSTRQHSADLLKDFDIIIYLTQDAVLVNPDSLAHLIAVFDIEKVGVAYGRQLPRLDAKPIEAHARLFNYPSTSELRDASSIAKKGIKAAFTSDSFAAYRVKNLIDVGGFPYTIGSEDMLVAAKMLQQGIMVAYVADATVYHSHSYSLKQEFSRYFDIGVMHSENPWLLSAFGKPEGEGLRFIKSEMGYLAKNSPLSIPSAIIRTFAKYAGYRVGLSHRKLTKSQCYALGMAKGYWNT